MPKTWARAQPHGAAERRALLRRCGPGAFGDPRSDPPGYPLVNADCSLNRRGCAAAQSRARGNVTKGRRVARSRAALRRVSDACGRSRSSRRSRRSRRRS
jgi:hypothetical protein